MVKSLCAFVAFVAVFLLVSTSAEISPDKHDQCQEWSEAGECENNASFMLINCATSCEKMQKATAANAVRVNSFYELEANDLEGHPVDFSKFENQVVVIVNVASECGYTAGHYAGMVEVWNNHWQPTGRVQLLAFPCNQFGGQEPGTPKDIRQFAEMKGVTFTMMEKVVVNGPLSHPVYQFLKQSAGGPSFIKWNFATYFVVDTSGTVKAFNGVEPAQLQHSVLGMLQEEL